MKEKAVSFFSAEKDEWTTWKEPADYDLNVMYIEEMKHFLDCVVSGARPVTDLRHAGAVLSAIFAAKESSRSGKVVRLS